MSPKGKYFLKVSSAIAMLLGVICVFVGFYTMASGMTGDNASAPENSMTLRLVSAGGMYVMVSGVVNVIAGFVGFINAAELEYATKCRNYGYILLAFAVINIVILVVFVQQWKALSLFLAIVPTIIAVVYYIGGLLNVLELKNQNN